MSVMSYITPLLLKPKAISLRNRWRTNLRVRSQVIRDWVIIGFGASVMCAIFRGGLWVLSKAHSDKTFVYLHPSVPLGLMLMFLMAMLFLSNCAAALASLYMSHDLDLILSSPVKMGRFFWGKFIDILVDSSWITMIFLLPAIFAFAVFYHMGPAFYLFIPLVLFPYFAIPTALAMVLVTLYARFFPASRARGGKLAIGSIALISLAAILAVFQPGIDRFSLTNLDDLLKLVAILSIPNSIWMPSYWASTCLAEYLEPTKISFLPFLVMLYAFAGALLSLAFVTISLLHFEAYSRASVNTVRSRIDSRLSQARLNSLLRFLSPPYRAIVAKEFRLFARDVTQIFQLLLLCGICILYFYNFRLVHSIESALPEESKRWWTLFLFMTNSCLEAFLITAVGMRFVFQSVSLEGRNFWILQCSPLTLHQILRAKFICWLIPVASVLGFVFGAGAIATHASLTMILLKIVTSWLICYGIVGLALGLGAFFANFTWEHSSQLAASFGSLVYMLASVALVSVDMALVAVALGVGRFAADHQSMTNLEQGLATGAVIAMIGYLNFLVTRVALDAGEKSLEQRRD